VISADIAGKGKSDEIQEKSAWLIGPNGSEIRWANDETNSSLFLSVTLGIVISGKQKEWSWTLTYRRKPKPVIWIAFSITTSILWLYSFRAKSVMNRRAARPARYDPHELGELTHLIRTAILSP
jgi:hypothetical protein